MSLITVRSPKEGNCSLQLHYTVREQSSASVTGGSLSKYVMEPTARHRAGSHANLKSPRAICGRVTEKGIFQALTQPVMTLQNSNTIRGKMHKNSRRRCIVFCSQDVKCFICQSIFYACPMPAYLYIATRPPMRQSSLAVSSPVKRKPKCQYNSCALLLTLCS